MTARQRTGRHVHTEEVMGTTVSFDVRGPDDPREAIDDACAWLHAVDARFSTYRPASEISQIARGETRGAFDADVSGSLDLSGCVKGWVAERAGRILERRGLTDFQIKAGGDIVVRGGAQPGEGSLIGLRHPDRRDAFADVALLRGGAIATSGDYERGGHVRDPRTGAPASGLRSVTVTEPDLSTADGDPRPRRARLGSPRRRPGRAGGVRDPGCGERGADGRVPSTSKIPSAPALVA